MNCIAYNKSCLKCNNNYHCQIYLDQLKIAIVKNNNTMITSIANNHINLIPEMEAILYKGYHKGNCSVCSKECWIDAKDTLCIGCFINKILKKPIT
jgi:hypothetical protein